MGNTKQEKLGKKIVSIIGQSDLKTQMQVFDLVNSEVTAALEELEKKQMLCWTDTASDGNSYRVSTVSVQAIQSIKERYSE